MEEEHLRDDRHVNTHRCLAHVVKYDKSTRQDRTVTWRHPVNISMSISVILQLRSDLQIDSEIAFLPESRRY